MGRRKCAHRIMVVVCFARSVAVGGAYAARAGIYIEVTGAAKCRWCEHVQQKRMTYRGSEVYLSARKYFVDAGTDNNDGGGDGSAGGSTVCVPRGEHVYNFTCALPVNLPTSFEGTFGHIRYRAEVTVNVPLWPDKTFAEGFTVIRSVDLNGLSDVRVSRCVCVRAWVRVCDAN